MADCRRAIGRRDRVRRAGPMAVAAAGSGHAGRRARRSAVRRRAPAQLPPGHRPARFDPTRPRARWTWPPRSAPRRHCDGLLGWTDGDTAHRLSTAEHATACRSRRLPIGRAGDTRELLSAAGCTGSARELARQYARGARRSGRPIGFGTHERLRRTTPRGRRRVAPARGRRADRPGSRRTGRGAARSVGRAVHQRRLTQRPVVRAGVHHGRRTSVPDRPAAPRRERPAVGGVRRPDARRRSLRPHDRLPPHG